MRNFKTFEEFSLNPFKKKSTKLEYMSYPTQDEDDEDEIDVEHGFNFDKIKSFYKVINKEKGANHRRVAWTSLKNQEVRFQKLLQIGVKNGDTILDFGCGLADLYGYAKKTGLNINYIGVDINEDYIRDAKKQYPDANIYLIKNIDDVKESYDWFLASGSLTLGFKYQEIISLLTKVYNKSRKGVAFNMLTKENIKTYKYVDSYYGSIFCNPRYIAQELSKISDKVGLIRGYLPIDFTIYMIK
jgi:ribosomal protein L11 methylase PrmA